METSCEPPSSNTTYQSGSSAYVQTESARPSPLSGFWMLPSGCATAGAGLHGVPELP